MSENSENGSSLFLARCLVLAWKTIADRRKRNIEETPVVFKNINFKKYETNTVDNELQVNILPCSGKFELCSNGKVCVDGNIKVVDNHTTEKITLPAKSIEKQVLESNDIYKELMIRGHNTTESNKCIKSSDIDADVGYITWKDWPTFINAMFHFDVLKKNSHNLHLIASVDSILIDPENHSVAVYGCENVPLFKYTDMVVMAAGGIQINGLKWVLVPLGTNSRLKVADEIKKPFKNVRLVSSLGGVPPVLRWEQSPGHVEERAGFRICDVHYSGLNHQDLLYASGKQLPGDKPSIVEDLPLGLEFSGRTSSKRVMGLARQTLSTTVMADERFLWEVPHNWSLAAAASVPVAYFTAYYALFIRGKLRRNQAVVVYNGCDDVGYAAITLALQYGCQVFVTYGSREQRGFILSKFLATRDDQNGHHWDPTFEKKVLERTKGKGADVILNLIGYEKVTSAVTCLADGGILLDICSCIKGDTTDLNLAALTSNKSYHSINMNNIPEADALAVVDLVTEGIRRGHVSPIHSQCFPHEHAEEAFKYLGEANRMGKVILRLRGECAETQAMLASPRAWMDPRKTYLVLGGVGDISMELSHWLISRGAARLVIRPAREVLTGYQIWCIKRWRDRGINVMISTHDVSTPEGLKAVINEASNSAPLDGVFDLTAVLPKEGLSNKKQIYEGLKMLDKTTRELVPNLSNVVILTSADDQELNDSIFKMIQHRKAAGLSGVAIRLGGSGPVENDNDEGRCRDGSLEETLRAAMAAMLSDLDKLSAAAPA